VKNDKPSQATLPAHPDSQHFLRGPVHIVYYITLNLNISASRQNIKNLINRFVAILAPLEWEENEVTNSHLMSLQIPMQNF